MKIHIKVFLSLAFGCTVPTALAQHPSKKDTFIVTDEYIGLKPTLYKNLGGSVTTPDALAVSPEGQLFLSVPNFQSSKSLGTKICTWNNKGELVTFTEDLPRDSTSGFAFPMGMAFGSDGNLYIADSQANFGKPHKSNLLKVTVQNGKAVKAEVVVTGFNSSNGVKAYKDRIYVTDSYLGIEGKQDQSGIYSFSIAELSEGLIRLKAEPNDAHLLCSFTTKVFNDRHEQGGADGLAFDKKGNLYCGNFGDGVISKMELTEDGKLKSQKIIVDSDKLRCCDGICYNEKSNSLYIVNFINNSVYVLDLNNNKLKKLWENDDSSGEDGLLDQPSDPIIYKGQLLIVNFDTFVFGKNKNVDNFHSISKFDLK